jgi:hypothetical protein
MSNRNTSLKGKQKTCCVIVLIARKFVENHKFEFWKIYGFGFTPIICGAIQIKENIEKHG